MLTLLLTDRGLSLTHETISNLMTINVNDKWWTPNEKSSIIKYAAEAYENAKRRVRVFDDYKSSKDEEAESKDEIESDIEFGTSDTDELV